MAASRGDAERDGVVVPTTMEEYCMKAKPPQSSQDNIEMDDFYDDCYDMDDEDENDDDDDDDGPHEAREDEDSGNGES